MSDTPHAVFIGYRREDTADVAGRLHDQLESKFGEGRVFKDVDSIPIGVSFRDYVPEVIAQCRVFLALIGWNWLDAQGRRGRRLNDPNDLVRIEIETALAAAPRLKVVPVLVNGAAAPARALLPESIRDLADLNAAVLRRDPDFRKDVGRLMDAFSLEIEKEPPGAAIENLPRDQTTFDDLKLNTDLEKTVKDHAGGLNRAMLGGLLGGPIGLLMGAALGLKSKSPDLNAEITTAVARKADPEFVPWVNKIQNWRPIEEALIKQDPVEALKEVSRQTSASQSYALGVLAAYHKYRTSLVS